MTTLNAQNFLALGLLALLGWSELGRMNPESDLALPFPSFDGVRRPPLAGGFRPGSIVSAIIAGPPTSWSQVHHHLKPTDSNALAEGTQ
jgi:hypothetical protein